MTMCSSDTVDCTFRRPKPHAWENLAAPASARTKAARATANSWLSLHERSAQPMKSLPIPADARISPAPKALRIDREFMVPTRRVQLCLGTWNEKTPRLVPV